MNVRIAAIAVLLTLVTTSASARADDARIADAAAQWLASYSRYTVFDDVCIAVAGGSILLTGKVTVAEKKDEIGRHLEQIAGVRNVTNAIQVLPPSSRDDALRKRTARSIYGNAAFWKYAARANPPIHIVVENGHVTLTGVVASESERVIAQSLATGLGELSLTNALKAHSR